MVFSHGDQGEWLGGGFGGRIAGLGGWEGLSLATRESKGLMHCRHVITITIIIIIIILFQQFFIIQSDVELYHALLNEYL